MGAKELQFGAWLRRRGVLAPEVDVPQFDTGRDPTGSGQEDSLQTDLQSSVPKDGAEPGLDVISPVRKPLVPKATQSGAPAAPSPLANKASKADEMESLLYGGPLTAEQRATLSDTRGDPSMTVGLKHLHNAQNTLLAYAGLPGTQFAGNPYADKRQELQQWLLQRGQAKRAGDATAQQDARTQAYLQATQAATERDAINRERQGRLDSQRLDREEREGAFRERELALKEGQLKGADERAAKTYEETARHNRASEGIGWANANRPRAGFSVDEDGNVVDNSPATKRLQMRRDVLAPPPGWEMKDPKAMGGMAFRDVDQAKKFDSAASSLEALKGHVEHFREAQHAFHAATSVKDKDKALGVMNQQMSNIASKLRVAEGLNNSDAANHAVDTMLSMVNGTVGNFRNMVNEGRVDAILDSAIQSANTNLERLNPNLRRVGAKAAASVDPGTPDIPDTVTVRRKKDGATKVLPRAQAARFLSDPAYEEVP